MSEWKPLTLDGLTKRIGWGIVFGIVVLGMAMLYSDVDALGRAASDFDFGVLLPVLGLSVVGYGMRVLKWHLYLRRLNIRLPFVEGSVVFLAGLVMSITPAKVGEVLKSFLLKQSHGLAVSRTAPIVVAERLTDFIALVLLALYGVATSGYGIGVVAVAGGMSLALLALMGSSRAGEWLLDRMESWPYLSRFVPALRDAYGASVLLMGARVTVVSVLLSIVAWGSEAVGMWLVLNAATGGAAPFGLSVFVFSFGTVAGALSMLPGGLVATEGSMVVMLFEVFRIVSHRGTATLVTLVVRFCTLWFGVLVGVFALIIHQRVYGGPTGRHSSHHG